MKSVGDTIWNDLEERTWRLVSADESNLGLVKNVNITAVTVPLMDELTEQT